MFAMTIMVAAIYAQSVAPTLTLTIGALQKAAQSF